jgi:integrase
VNRLTVRRIQSWMKKAAPGGKLYDGGGLYLRMLPSGSATWQLKYHFEDPENADRRIERTYSLGQQHFAPTELAAARAKRDEIKKLHKTGRDPVQAQRLAKAERVASSGETFRDLVQDWLKKQKRAWSAIHYDKSSKAIERHVTCVIGDLPVRDIKPKVIAKIIEDVQSGGKRETAAKLLQHIRAVFKLAAATGLRDDNPADACSAVLDPAGDVKRRPALLDFPALGELLRTADRAAISPEVRLCHRLIAFTTTRIANATAARWSEFDLDAMVSTWRIARASMKVRRGRSHDHVVVLPDSIAEDLRRWRQTQADAKSLYLFPRRGEGRGEHRQPTIARESVEKMLHSLGYKDRHVAHGWRASFSTLAKDSGLFDRQVIDLALDHVHDSEVARAYDRGERWKQRVALATWWGKQLVEAQRGGVVVQMSTSRGSARSAATPT